MSLLEERIKRAAKNRPVIRKPTAVEPEVPTVRSGGAAGGGRPNRVIPTAAQPAPTLVRDREVGGGDQTSGIKR